MANIPINQSYIKKEAAPTATSSGINTDLAQLVKDSLAKAQTKISGAADPSTSSFSYQANPLPPGGTSATLGRPAKAFFSGLTNSVMSSLPSMADEAKSGRIDLPENVLWNGAAPSSDAYILGFGGGKGEVIVDPNARDQVFKMERPEFTPAALSREKKLLLGNRSSKLYEVDHIVPLWAGGTNNLTNYEVLTKAKHKTKTKVQAVALTLLGAHKITPKEALEWSMNWEQLDREGIPNPFGEKNQGANNESYGTVPMYIAEQKLAKWKSDKVNGIYPNIKKPGFFETMRDETFARDYGEKAIPDWVPFKGTIREVLKGATSGVTAGWFPYIPDTDTNPIQKVAGVVGVIGGALLPIGMLGKGVAAATVARGYHAKTATYLAKSGLIGKNAQTRALAGEDMAKILITPKMEAFKRSVKSIHPMDKAMWETMSKFFVGGVAYGQVGPEGIAGKIAGDPNATPVKRLIEDIAYGGLGTFAAPTMRGTAAVGAGVFMGSLLFDYKDMDPKQSLINASIMMGLHRFGAPGMKKRIQEINQFNDDINTSAAHTIFASVLGKKEFPHIAKASEVPAQGAKTYSKARVEELRARAHQLVDEDFAFDPHTKERLHRDIDVAARQLTKRGLPASERTAADIEDVQLQFEIAQMDDQALRNSRVRPRIVDDVEAVINKKLSTLPEAQQKQYLANLAAREGDAELGLKPGVFTKTQLTAEDGSPLTWPVGRGAGVGAGLEKEDSGGISSVLGDNLRELTANRASDAVVMVNVRSQEPMNRVMNERIPDEVVSPPGGGKPITLPSQRPENTVEIYGFFWGPDGKIVLKPISYAPRKIKYNSVKKSINPEANEAPRPSKYKRPETYNEEMNKDAIADAMDANDTDVVIGRMDFDNDATGASAVWSEKPYSTFVINDKHLPISKEFTAELRALMKDKAVAKANLQDVILKSKNSRNKKTLEATNKIIRETIEEPADEVLLVATRDADLPPEVKQQLDLTINLLQDLRGAIEGADSPTTLKSNMDGLGIILAPGEETSLFAGRNDLSISTALKTVMNAAAEGRLIGAGGRTRYMAIDDGVRPFFDSDVYMDWDLRAAFPSMKLLGNKPMAQKVAPVPTKSVVPGETLVEGGPLVEGVGPEQAPLPYVQPKVRMSKAAKAISGNSRKTGVGVKKVKKQPTNWLGGPDDVVKPKAQEPKVAIKANEEPTKETEWDAAKAKEEAAKPIVKDEKEDKRVEELLKKLSISVPKKQSKSRTTAASDIVGQRTNSLETDLRGIEFNQRAGEGAYKKMLLSKIEEAKIKPGMRVGDRVLGSTETSKINQDIENTGRNLALNIYEEKISPAQQAAQFTNTQFGDSEMVALRRAMNKDSFVRFSTEVEELRKQWGDKKFNNIWEALNKKKYEAPQPKTQTPQRDWGLSRELGKQVIADFVDRPKTTLKRGETMREFAEYLDKAFTKALGEKWRENGLIAQLFDLGGAPSGTRKNDMLGSLFASTAKGKTQPKGYLASEAVGSRRGMRTAAEKRSSLVQEQEIARQEMKDAQAIKRQQGSGRETVADDGNLVGAGSGSTEDRFGLKFDEYGMDANDSATIETMTQRDSDNVSIASALDDIFSAVSLKEAGSITPENAMAMAEAFVYKVKNAYDARSSAFKHFNKGEAIPDRMEFSPETADGIMAAIVDELSSAGVRVSDPAGAPGNAFRRMKKISKAVEEDREAARRILPEAQRLYYDIAGKTMKYKPRDAEDLLKRMIKYKGALYAKYKRSSVAPSNEEESFIALVDRLGELNAYVTRSRRQADILYKDLANKKRYQQRLPEFKSLLETIQKKSG